MVTCMYSYLNYVLELCELHVYNLSQYVWKQAAGYDLKIICYMFEDTILPGTLRICSSLPLNVPYV